jgi:hypothetical protein
MPTSVLQAGFLETEEAGGGYHTPTTTFWPTVSWQVVLRMLEKNTLFTWCMMQETKNYWTERLEKAQSKLLCSEAL